MHRREKSTGLLCLHFAAVLSSILLDCGGDLLYNNLGCGGTSGAAILNNRDSCGFVSCQIKNQATQRIGSKITCIGLFI